MIEARPLTFATLDGLAFAAERGRLSGSAPISSDGTIGPLLEWLLLSHTGLLPAPDTVAWFSLGSTAPLIVAMCSGVQEWICPVTHSTGFFRMPPAWPKNDSQWVGFGLAAQRAAVCAGFHRQIAAQFVGAMGELVDNVYEHSHSPSTGVAVFNVSERGFEFVVADHGIGVLDSLRSCQEYRDISDHGEALKLTLADGVSRYGSAAKRGYGFRPIFVGLANLSGLLRFRSGDHALIIDGQTIDRMAAKLAQKSALGGFMAYVCCKLPR